MRSPKILFIDLDGTLIDPRLGIINSVTYALNKYNIKVKVTDSGNDSYKEGAKTVTFRIWVK